MIDKKYDAPNETNTQEDARAARAALARALDLSATAASKAANAASIAARATEIAINVVAAKADKATLAAAASTLKAAKKAAASARTATAAAEKASAAAASTLDATTITTNATKTTKTATTKAARAAVSPNAVAATRAADNAAKAASIVAAEAETASGVSETAANDSADSVTTFVTAAKDAALLVHEINADNAAEVAAATAAAAAAAADAAASAATAAADVTLAAVTAANIIAVNADYNRALIEASIDPLITIDAKGNIGDANKAMEEMTGYPRGKLIGMDAFSYFNEPELARKGYNEVLDKDFIRDLPLSIKHKSGRATDVLYNASVYRDKSGVINGVFAAARDISEQKKSLAKIKHLASFPQLNMAPVMEFDLKGDLIYANPAARALSRRLEIEDYGEWLPPNWQRLLPSAKSAHRKSLKTEMRHGEKTFIEHLHFVREFNVLRLYMADITQQTRAFEALRSNDIRLHQIVDLMPQLIYVINWDEQLLMSNKAFKEFFGYSGVTPICFCGSSIEEDRTVMMEGTIVTLMETVEDRHGQKHELGTTKVPYQYIGDEGRQTHAVLAVSQDLTEVAEYERNQRQNLKQLKATLAGTVNTVIAISNMRDPYTAGHETRVADLAVAIASEMGRSADEIEELRIIAVLHDLGKIYVPAEILSKPGRLTETEFELVKTHPRVGYDIMKEAALPMHIANTILQHHERVDGSGYPLGIKGNKINPDARILAVADVVEAMNSHRPYRASLGIDEALKEIRKNIGKLYDPDVVKACLKLFKDRKFVFH